MAVSVRIPVPLRNLTGGQEMVSVDGKTIRELVDNLEQSYPGFQDRICDEKKQIRRFVNIYVNEEDIRFLKGVDTEIKEADDISIIPAIAGGSTAWLTGTVGR